MNKNKSSLLNLLYLAAGVLIIGILFWWYAVSNSNRIKEQNLNYAKDSAELTVQNLNSQFEGAQQRAQIYAYFLGMSDDIVINANLLKNIENYADFDAIRFINADGENLTSDGTVTDSSDRDYFVNGMNGESGCTMVFNSRVTGRTTMVFYAPIVQNENSDPIGVLLGVYYADEYLQETLKTTYFDEDADVYLCANDGEIIATSNGDKQNGFLPDILRENQIIDKKTAENVWKVFRGEIEEGGFICSSGNTDNICVLNVEEGGYVLVQTFPQSITKSMTLEANETGLILLIVLGCLFVAYAVYLIISNHRKHLKLENENQELNYILKGINKLYRRFVLLDFEADTYSFLQGSVPIHEDFPLNGVYEDFIAYLATFPIEEENKTAILQEMESTVLARELSDGGIYQHELWRYDGEGKRIWERMVVINIDTTDEKTKKALFLRQDITSLKEREAKAQTAIATANRKETQYRIAVTSAAFCSFEFNLTQDLLEYDVGRTINGKKISFLKRFNLTAPCKASECFEKWEAFILDESLSEFKETTNLENLKRRFENGETEISIDFWGWASEEQKEKMCVRQTFILTQNEQTKNIIVLAIYKDITAQVIKQREQTQALQDALMQAQRANRAKTTFLSNMSHDIRTPMNAIIGFTTLAASHIDNKSQVRDCLQKVLSSSNHLLSLINDILDMSRIESGKVQIVERECNISELTHNLVNIIQPQVKAKQLDLFIDTYDVVNENIIADPLKLSQVFVNLMSNAVKYTPAGGTVFFRIRQQTTFRHGYGDYEFIVKDNGIGMSPEFVEHIFEPFEREASTTKTGIQGAGLGMAITKNIIDIMGGTITINSEKDKGSEFIVKLSLKIQDNQSDTEKIKELEGLRALIVDDDCDNCESVSKMLKQIGMRSEWTTSGKEAVYKAQAAHDGGDSYHTYILDWQMPTMSGVETARRIRSVVGNDSPIIILTAYDWTDIEEEAKKAGVTAFCAKPLFMSDLKSVLLATNDLAKKEEIAAWTEEDFNGKRVLLVEDNELNREIAESILEETGFVVETATDGTDAVKMVQSSAENYYDAILMDVQMPIMDGYEATRTIRALPRKDVETLPIIAMTANAMEEDKEAALKNGMNAHIAKPIDIKTFLDVLSKYLK